MILSNLSQILGRKQLKISQVIADTGISRPTLTALYYNTGKGINFDTFNTLCKYLNITPNDLFSLYDIDIKSINVEYNTSWTFPTYYFDETYNSPIYVSGALLFHQTAIQNTHFYGKLTYKEDTRGSYELKIYLECSSTYYPKISSDSAQNYILRSLIKEIETTAPFGGNGSINHLIRLYNDTIKEKPSEIEWLKDCRSMFDNPSIYDTL